MADYTLKNQGDVTTFLISDEHLEPFAVPRAAANSGKLIAMLKTSGVDALAAALEEEFADLYITGVDLVTPSGDLVLVRRREYFIGANAQEAKHFFSKALQELQITHAPAL